MILTDTHTAQSSTQAWEEQLRGKVHSRLGASLHSGPWHFGLDEP